VLDRTYLPFITEHKKPSTVAGYKQIWNQYLKENGAMVVFLTEIMPDSARTSGSALAYSLATAIFGGLTPAVSTYLIYVTGNRAVPEISGCPSLPRAAWWRRYQPDLTLKVRAVSATHSPGPVHF
jgi:hypothetical protein